MNKAARVRKDQYQSKMELIEELVNKDLGNGKHVSKSVAKRLIALGIEPEEAARRLKEAR